MQRWVNLGETFWLCRVRQPHISQMAHPAIQILPPLELKCKSGNAQVSNFVFRVKVAYFQRVWAGCAG
jgi:hypothetical protein